MNDLILPLLSGRPDLEITLSFCTFIDLSESDVVAMLWDLPGLTEHNLYESVFGLDEVTKGLTFPRTQTLNGTAQWMCPKVRSIRFLSAEGSYNPAMLLEMIEARAAARAALLHEEHLGLGAPVLLKFVRIGAGCRMDGDTFDVFRTLVGEGASWVSSVPETEDGNRRVLGTDGGTSGSEGSGSGEEGEADDLDISEDENEGQDEGCDWAALIGD